MITITITPQSVINDSNQPLLSVMSDDQSVLPNPHPLSTDDANNSNQLVLTMGEIIFFCQGWSIIKSTGIHHSEKCSNWPLKHTDDQVVPIMGEQSSNNLLLLKDHHWLKLSMFHRGATMKSTSTHHGWAMACLQVYLWVGSLHIKCLMKSFAEKKKKKEFSCSHL